MITNRQLFFSTVAQTSKFPLAFEVVKAQGVYMYGPEGEKCIDLISGISVSNLGHCNKRIVDAVKKQAETFMYLMVYGEFIQAPQVQLAKLLTSELPSNLNNVYFVNSGSEANEGALKLAKRYTGRSEVISFKDCYHGSTQGVLSIIGREEYKTPFRPLIPDTRLITFNKFEHLDTRIVDSISGQWADATTFAQIKIVSNLPNIKQTERAWHASITSHFPAQAMPQTMAH